MAAPEADMRLQVNGTVRIVAHGTTLLQLVEQLGLDRRFLLVEHNGEPVPRQRLLDVQLRDGDRLELARPVAGG